MRKNLIFLPIIFLIVYILVCPADAVNSASTGLMLWYQKLLPTLLPFAIISNILIDSNYLSYLTRYLYPVTRFLLPTSEAGSYAFLSGFLFGFPMGSKNCAKLYQAKLISFEEVEILTIVCNNISPVFISGYLITQQLQIPSWGFISILILYLPAILLGNILLRKNKYSSQKMPASRSQINFKIIDTGIMNGFETLTKLGGYIMMFSIITSAIEKLPFPTEFSCILTGLTEITKGIAQIPETISSSSEQYLIAIGITAFGGISGIVQTCSVTKDCHFSIKKYCCYRILLALLSLISAFLFLKIQSIISLDWI